MNPRIYRRTLFSLLISLAWLHGCGGGSSGNAPLNLGGGLFMTVDGEIIGATPLAEPDFLFATAEEWKSFAPQKIER